MIHTNSRQEKVIKDYGRLINSSKARIMHECGLAMVESRREGIYVWDDCGDKYVDCRDDAGVYNLGRKPAELVKVLRHALTEFDLGNNLFFSEPRIRLAKKLGSISPGRALTAVTFGVSGGEIVDFAIKVARAVTGRKKVIAMEQGFYGCTGISVTATHAKKYKKPFEPLIPDVVHVPFGDHKVLKRKIGKDTACVIIEPIQGHAGVIIPPEGYLQKVREICDKEGALLIVDEIQTGLGRTGKMFAIEHSGVIPDIITVGKALSGGIFPITAALMRPELMKFWDEYPFSHLSTFGGSDLGCEVASRAIELIEEKKLPKRARDAGERFSKGFAQLKARYPNLIKDFRNLGLLMAIEFTKKDLGPLMSKELSFSHVLSPYMENSPEKMRILPPLIIEDHEIDFILNAFDEALLRVANPVLEERASDDTRAEGDLRAGL